MILLIIFACIILILVVISHYKIDISKFEIYSKKIPKNFENFKIIHLSDLHSRQFGKNNKKLLDIIKKLEPNIVVMTGDMVNGKYENIEQLEQLISRINEICNIYYVLGNREFNYNRKSIDQFINMLIKNNVNILINDKCKIMIKNSYINIFGINYCNRGINEYYLKRKNNFKSLKKHDKINNSLEEILPSLNNKEYNILLAHDPLRIEDYSKHEFDLVLTGHIHGGIIRIPFIGGMLSPDVSFFPKYYSGEYKVNKTYMCVSRGLGYGTIPFRILNNPEIVVITLKTNS